MKKLILMMLAVISNCAYSQESNFNNLTPVLGFELNGANINEVFEVYGKASAIQYRHIKYYCYLNNGNTIAFMTFDTDESKMVHEFYLTKAVSGITDKCSKTTRNINEIYKYLEFNSSNSIINYYGYLSKNGFKQGRLNERHFNWYLSNFGGKQDRSYVRERNISLKYFPKKNIPSYRKSMTATEVIFVGIVKKENLLHGIKVMRRLN